jgi:hypothetical protein
MLSPSNPLIATGASEQVKEAPAFSMVKVFRSQKGAMAAQQLQEKNRGDIVGDGHAWIQRSSCFVTCKFLPLG